MGQTLTNRLFLSLISIAWLFMVPYSFAYAEVDQDRMRLEKEISDIEQKLSFDRAELSQRQREAYDARAAADYYKYQTGSSDSTSEKLIVIKRQLENPGYLSELEYKADALEKSVHSTRASIDRAEERLASAKVALKQIDDAVAAAKARSTKGKSITSPPSRGGRDPSGWPVFPLVATFVIVVGSIAGLLTLALTTRKTTKQKAPRKDRMPSRMPSLANFDEATRARILRRHAERLKRFEDQ